MQNYITSGQASGKGKELEKSSLNGRRLVVLQFGREIFIGSYNPREVSSIDLEACNVVWRHRITALNTKQRKKKLLVQKVVKK